MIVNIQQVNPPGPQSTGKFGHLVTDSGKIFFPVDMMGEFQPGTTVDIRTKDQTWGVTQVKVVASRPTMPVQGQTGYHRPANTQAPYRANTGFQPRVVGGSGAPAGMPATEEEAPRRIFVCGVVQANRPFVDRQAEADSPPPTRSSMVRTTQGGQRCLRPDPAEAQADGRIPGQQLRPTQAAARKAWSMPFTACAC